MTRSQRHKILVQTVASDGKSRGEGVRGYPDYTGGAAPAIISRLAHRLYGAGYNGATVQLTGDGTAKTYSATFVNESGATITTASLVSQGWGLIAAGTQNAGNDFPETGNIEYPVGGAQTVFNQAASPSMTVPDGGLLISDDAILSTPIPAGASFKVNLSATVPNGQKYISNLGFAGIRTKALSSTLRKEALYAIGDSVATNNGGAVTNAALGRCPCYQASIIGTTAQTYGASGAANFVKQVALAVALGITRFISNYGTNDMPVPRTNAQILGDLLAMRTLAVAAGIKFTQCTILPRTSIAAAVTASLVTSVGNVMTMTVPDASRFPVGEACTIAGATQTEYNGVKICIARDTTANTLSFTFIGSGTTPATGTITVQPTRPNGLAVGAWQLPNTAAYNPGGASVRGLLNASIRTPGVFDDFIDWADAVEPSRDSGRWAAAGENALLLGTFITTIKNATPRTNTRFQLTDSMPSGVAANGRAQFQSGANVGQQQQGSGNTLGDYTSNVAFGAVPAVGDSIYMVPGVGYISDDGTHPRVSTGGYGGQAILDQVTTNKIIALLA